MPIRDSDERFVYRAVLIMLLLALLGSACGALLHWFGPVHRTVDLVIPPVLFLIFAGLFLTLIRRPRWVLGIAQTALVVVALLLAVPSWVLSLRAAMTPGLELMKVFPPAPALLVIWMVMVMLFIPGRWALLIALFGWCVIASPVLIYLFFHPHEMEMLRGMDFLMAYGPIAIMPIVLLPLRHGFANRIRRLTLERSRMETMINLDPLTRIYNRHVAEQILQDILDDKSPAGVIMFDMDKFKAINDTHGHPVGDSVLQTVARRCKELLRQHECISRWGGEEFMVVVPNVDARGLQQVAKRLQLAIAEPPIGEVGQVTASFGATLVQDWDTLASLLQRVDRALYQAKRRGGDCVVSAQIVLEGVPALAQPQDRGGLREKTAS